MTLPQPLPGTSSGWREFRDPVRATTVFLHRSGLWFEVDTETATRPAVDGDEVRLAKAIQDRLRQGATGQHDIVVYESTSFTGPQERHIYLQRAEAP